MKLDRKTKLLILRIALVAVALILAALFGKLANQGESSESSPVEVAASDSRVNVPEQEESSSVKETEASVEETVDSSEPEYSFDFSEEESEDSKPDSGELNDPAGPTGQLDKYGNYYDKDLVALYINTYQSLPDNFITKSEAQDLGWSGGSLEKYAPGKCIGGDKFGNKEKLLPTAKGRQYYECDIDTLGKKSRGAKRIVFSNDGLIYYTDDHYESFILLYGEE